MQTSASEAASKSASTPVASSPVVSTPASNVESAASSGAAVVAGAVQREIETIKTLIADQTKTITAQAQHMQALAVEVESLKAKLG